MIKKVIITLISIVLLIIGVKFLLPNDGIEKQEKVEEINETISFELPKLEEENLSALIQMDNFELNSSTLKAKPIKSKQMTQNIKEIYTEIDQDDLEKEMPSRKGFSHRLAVNISNNSISKLNVGDVIQLPSVGQVDYQATIDKKIVHKNGSVSVTANLNGNSNYSAVLTEGKNNSYATFSTPEGSFELETRNGKGYIYSVREMEDKLINPNKDDFIDPKDIKN